MNEERAAYWCQTISECNESGMTVAEWCRQHGIRADAYYKWQSRLIRAGVITSTKHTNQRTQAALQGQKAGFVEISLKQPENRLREDSGVTISRNGYSINVTTGFSEDALLRVLEVVSHA